MTRRAHGPAAILAVAVAVGALFAASPANGQDVDPERPSPTPFTVAPRLLNLDEVRDALVGAYPTELREEGIGGRTLVFFFIDQEGLVQNALVSETSGNPELDEAALSVAPVYRFSPAMNREERVPVWVVLPITFEVRQTPPND